MTGYMNDYLRGTEAANRYWLELLIRLVYKGGLKVVVRVRGDNDHY